MTTEDLQKVRKNLTVKEKEQLAEQFNIKYRSLQNILNGSRKRSADAIFIAAVKLISDRKNQVKEASKIIQSEL